MLDKIKKVAGQFERDVAFMKWRWFGNVIWNVAMVVAMVVITDRSTFLVVDQKGVVYSAHRAEERTLEVMLIEADAHARAFYATMWTFDHNNIDKQQKRATYLGGTAISKTYSDLQARGFYNVIRANGYYVESEIDSIDLKSFSFNGTSVFLRAYGTMRLSNSDFYEIRKLDMELEMYPVERVLTRNPNGLSIEAVNLLTNETIKKGQVSSGNRPF